MSWFIHTQQRLSKVQLRFYTLAELYYLNLGSKIIIFVIKIASAIFIESHMLLLLRLML